MDFEMISVFFWTFLPEWRLTKQIYVSPDAKAVLLHQRIQNLSAWLSFITLDYSVAQTVQFLYSGSPNCSLYMNFSQPPPKLHYRSFPKDKECIPDWFIMERQKNCSQNHPKVTMRCLVVILYTWDLKLSNLGIKYPVHRTIQVDKDRGMKQTEPD